MWTRYFADVFFASCCHFARSPLKNVFFCAYYVPWYILSFLIIWCSLMWYQHLQNKFQMLTLKFSIFSALCFCVALPFKFGVTFSLVFIFLMNQHDSLRNIVQNIPNYYTHQVLVRFWVILVRIWCNGLVVRVALNYRSSGSGFETTSWP